MGVNDLIPLGQPGNEERDKAVRAKIKGSSSQRRKIAQQISGLNYMKDKDKKAERILELIRSPEASAIQLRKLANSILDTEDLSIKQRMDLLKVLNDTHKTIFGTVNKNLNVNINKSDSASKLHELYVEMKNDNGRTDTETSH